MVINLWIDSKDERDKVVCALFNNGYTLKLVDRPNERFPLTVKDKGISIIDYYDKAQ